MSPQPPRSARERARERLWDPTPERVELLAALSELFADERLTRERAIEESAVVLGELLGDAAVIDMLSAERDWMYPLGAHHPDPGPRALLIPHVTPAEVEALQPEIAPVCAALGVRGFIVAPLAIRGRCTGFLWQVRLRAGEPLGDDDRRFLEEVAIRLALGIESWRLAEALELATPAPAPAGAPAPRPGDLERILTARERTILARIVAGDGDRAIAERLQLSARAVAWYRHRIEQRLGVRERAELVAAARRHGLGA